MTVLLDDRLKSFLHSPIMVIVATRDSHLKPAIARAAGARVRDDHLFDVFISRSQWPVSIEHLLAEYTPVAVTCASPANYETYQIKGHALSVTPTDDEDRKIAEGAISAAISLFSSMGVPRSLADQWLTLEGLWRITIRAEAVFLQTPGPGAGQPRLEQA